MRATRRNKMLRDDPQGPPADLTKAAASKPMLAIKSVDPFPARSISHMFLEWRVPRGEPTPLPAVPTIPGVIDRVMENGATVLVRSGSRTETG